MKGKAEPLALFRPLRPRARFGSDVTRTHAAPLVGSELEKPLLIGTFERSAQQRSCQLVTIVGEPGVGKSRLCAELFAYIEDRPGLVRWRQGRCLPYGEGIAFWALGEIVKAECGILESDSPDEAAAKLERALPAGRSRPRLAQGPPCPARRVPAASPPHRRSRSPPGGASSSRWADDAARRCSSSRTCTGPTRRCSPSSSTWPTGRRACPLLAPLHRPPGAVRAAPELRRPALRNATTINLAPLTRRGDGPPDRVAARAGGAAGGDAAGAARARGRQPAVRGGVRAPARRPRRARERGGGAGLGAGADRRPPGHPRPGAQEPAPGRRRDRQGVLGGRARRDGRARPGRGRAGPARARAQGARPPARTSSMEGEAEYGFWHLLVRDVCYAQIPRAARAARHRAAAAWIERKAGERVEDLADVLAHHYLTRSSSPAPPATRARRGARGERRSATSPWPASARLRSTSTAPSRAWRRRSRSPLPATPSAPRCSSAGRRRRSSRAGCRRQRRRSRRRSPSTGSRARRRRRAGADRALGRARTPGRPASEEVVAEALGCSRRSRPAPSSSPPTPSWRATRFVDAAYAEAIAAAERALALAAELGLPEPARALGIRGIARAYLGDRQGLEDMRRALQLAVEQGAGPRRRRPAQQPRDRQLVSTRGRRRRSTPAGRGSTSASGAASPSSRWDRRHERDLPRRARPAGAGAGRGRSRSRSAWQRPATSSSSSRARCSCACSPSAARTSTPRRRRARRGRARERRAAAVARWRSRPARGCCSPRAARSRRTRCSSSSSRSPAPAPTPTTPRVLPELVRTALALDEPELAARLVDGVEPRHTALRARALRLPRRSSPRPPATTPRPPTLYAEAAERWREFGNVPERAYALLGQGRCLAALGRARGGGAAARGARALRVDGLQARARRDRGAARRERGRGRLAVRGSAPIRLRTRRRSRSMQADRPDARKATSSAPADSAPDRLAFWLRLPDGPRRSEVGRRPGARPRTPVRRRSCGIAG